MSLGLVDSALHGASPALLRSAQRAARTAAPLRLLNPFCDWREPPPSPAVRDEGSSILHGSVVATKANICATGLRATAGSKMLHNYIAPYDATAIQRLTAAGAFVAGSTNMDEFGMGSATAFSSHGPSLNPFSAPVVIARACNSTAVASSSARPAADEHQQQQRQPISSRAWLTPGGSSGGSAVAVSLGAVSVALGSDTGGSVRQPAAFCGVVGFKPSYGRVSRWGLIPYASSLDTVGVIARSVRDAAATYDVIAGPDARDDTCLRTPHLRGGVAPSIRRVLGADAAPGNYMAWRASAAHNSNTHSCSGGGAWHVSDALAALPLAGLRVGIPREYSVAGMSSVIGDWWDTGAKLLAEAGAHIVPVSLPHTSAALPAYYVLAPAEAASNLSRYDGVRYGYRAAPRAHGSSPESSQQQQDDSEAATHSSSADKASQGQYGSGSNAASALHDEYRRTRTEGFGAEVRRRLLMGNFVLSRGARRDFYDAAQIVRARVRGDFDVVFRPVGSASHSGVDVLLTPSTPTLPWASLDTVALSPSEMAAADVMTVPTSLAGLPALSLPVGYAPYDDAALNSALREAEEGGVVVSGAARERILSEATLPVGLQLIGRYMDEDTVLAVGHVLEGEAGFVLPEFART